MALATANATINFFGPSTQLPFGSQLGQLFGRQLPFGDRLGQLFGRQLPFGLGQLFGGQSSSSAPSPFSYDSSAALTQRIEGPTSFSEEPIKLPAPAPIIVPAPDPAPIIISAPAPAPVLVDNIAPAEA